MQTGFSRMERLVLQIFPGKYKKIPSKHVPSGDDIVPVLANLTAQNHNAF